MQRHWQYLQNPTKQIAKIIMRSFIIFASAFALVLYAFASRDIVQVGGEYFQKDANGNLIKISKEVAEANKVPRRRPTRAGKFGMPHPSAWSEDIDSASKKVVETQVVSSPQAQQQTTDIVASASVGNKEDIVEAKNSKEEFVFCITIEKEGKVFVERKVKAYAEKDAILKAYTDALKQIDTVKADK